MDRFKQIETFVRVAEAGSLAAAALEEGVSPVILGRRIDALEKRLGVKLMYRSTRRLVVSEDGAAFLDRCRGLLTEWDQAENELTAGRRAVNGHLIVSAPAAFGRMHVAPHAPAFIADKPELQMSFNLTDRVVDLVREGYDLSIRIGGAVDPNFVAVKLATNRRVVCGTPAYFKKHGKPKTLEDLPGAQLPRVQSARRTKPRLVLPSQRQARDRARVAAISTATTANCCTGGCRKGSGSAGARRGKSSGNWRRANWKPSSTNTRCPTTTSSRSIRSSATCRRECATSLII